MAGLVVGLLGPLPLPLVVVVVVVITVPVGPYPEFPVLIGKVLAPLLMGKVLAPLLPPRFPIRLAMLISVDPPMLAGRVTGTPPVPEIPDPPIPAPVAPVPSWLEPPTPVPLPPTELDRPKL